MQRLEGAQRVIVRAYVQDIPGDLQARPFTLGELFCQSELKRSLREHNDNGFDAVHIPPSFDSENNVKVWFMFDLGVKGPITRGELLQIPLNAFVARFDKEHGRCIDGERVKRFQRFNDLG
ncbi:hypothetical protein LTR49_020775 [Elasticomyces elasticus]|nr:hypothetical protein LTR49_020775 [Elasticomyces elasticus]